MPYIQKEEREKYDSVIDELATLLKSLDNDKLSGVLNYTIFRLAKQLCNPLPVPGIKRGYSRMATVLSAIHESGIELRRRILVPYEDEKIELNGDVEC